MSLTPADWIQIVIIVVGFVITITTLKNDVKHLDRRLTDHIASDAEKFSEHREDIHDLRNRFTGGR